MPKINEFVAEMKSRKGLAMANRYRVNISLPESLSLGASTSRSLDLLCDSATLPGRVITTVDYQAHKQVIKVPTSFANEDVSFTFLLTGDFYAKKIFDKWLDEIVNFDTYKANYLNRHVSQVNIYQTVNDPKKDEPEDLVGSPTPSVQETPTNGSNLNPVATEPAVMMPPFVVSERRESDNPEIYGVTLQGAYPIAVSSINLDNTSENTIQKVTVVMTYENFKVIDRFRSI